ncbi:MAG: hypothetical protein QXZ25_06810 [Candidatus Bathyarchaeia archaeon]
MRIHKKPLDWLLKQEEQQSLFITVNAGEGSLTMRNTELTSLSLYAGNRLLICPSQHLIAQDRPVL